MTTEGEAPHAKINYEHPSSYDGYYLLQLSLRITTTTIDQCSKIA
jgi:hypothetical protein